MITAENLRDEKGLPACLCSIATHLHGTAAMYELHGCGCVPCTAANNLLFRRRRMAALPNCDCPRAKHLHGTRIMYNRHQCPCDPCGEANRVYTRNNKRYTKLGLPVCDCPKSTHEHGTRAMYSYHCCRCASCKVANREYNQTYKSRTPHVHPMTDGRLVRAKITALRAAGLTLDEIADMCGLNPAVIHYDVNGRDGRQPPAKVRASTLHALNAIRTKDIAAVQKPSGRKVNGDVPRLQVQSLYSTGWDANDIAGRVGVTKSTINNLLKGLGTTEKVRSGIETLHAELHGTSPAQNTPARKRKATRAKQLAAANGWTTDTAEDHLYAAAA